MPIRNQNGNAPVIRSLDCVSTVIYEGALLFMSTTGLVGMASSSIISSTMAKKIVGVAVQPKAAAAANVKVLANISPDQVFVMQTDDATVTAITDCVGRNFKLVAPAGGNSSTLRSICEIDGNTGTSIGTSQTSAEIVKCIGVYKGLDNTLGAGNTWVALEVVILNKYHMLTNATGV
jgi:TRAP-type uncharacterized transport system substrate-binding protein